MAARYDVMLGIHAVVESGHSVNVMYLMDGNLLDLVAEGDMPGNNFLVCGDLLLVDINLVHGSLYQSNT